MNLNHLIIPITIAVILILILVLIVCGYVKAPPDQAYIISGLKHDVPESGSRSLNGWIACISGR